MRIKKIKRKQLKSILLKPIISISLLLYLISIFLITYVKANAIMDSNIIVGKALMSDFYTNELLPRIDLTEYHDKKDIYKLIVSMENEINLKETLLSYNILDNDIMVSHALTPDFSFSSINQGSSAFKSNFWSIDNITEYKEDAILNVDETITNQNVLIVNQYGIIVNQASEFMNVDVVYCEFLDYSNPDAMVSLYELSQESSNTWKNTDELLLYGNMGETGVFQTVSIEFIKNRDLNKKLNNIQSNSLSNNLDNSLSNTLLPNEYTLIDEVIFDDSYNKEELVWLLCEKESINQYYMNQPLRKHDIEHGYNERRISFSLMLTYEIDDVNPSLFHTRVYERFPISNEFTVMDDTNGKSFVSQEYINMYSSFSPILEAINELYYVYIILAIINVLITYICYRNLYKRILVPLTILPKVYKRGMDSIDAIEANCDIQEYIDFMISLKHED